MTHVATLTVQDTKAPVLDGVPGDTDVQCFSQIPPQSAASVQISDNCDAGAVLVESHESQHGAPGTCRDGSTVYHWTATDACANSATGSQTVVVRET